MFAKKLRLPRLLLAALLVALIVAFLYYFRAVPKTELEPVPKPNLVEFKSSNQELAQYLKPNLKPRLSAKITLDPKLWRSTFEIDKGQLDGVVIGNAITDSNNQVIGLVAQTQAKTSTVNTLANIKTNLPVSVASIKNKGLLTGLYGYSAEVNWLQNGQDLNNKPIYTTNFSKNTQENLLIGIAQNTQLGKSGSFYRVDVTDLATDWKDSQDVLVW